MKRLFLPVALASLACFLPAAGRAGVPEVEPAPSTGKQPVTDLYHGVTVQDDFRWLEQLNDPKVKAWAESQNARAEKFLNALPGRAQMAAQIKKLISSIPPNLTGLQLTGGKVFALKFDPAKQQRFIVVLSSPDNPGSEKVICDPNAIDTSGATSADWFVPSPDGKIIAVSLSKHGTEDGDLCFFDVETGNNCQT